MADPSAQSLSPSDAALKTGIRQATAITASGPAAPPESVSENLASLRQQLGEALTRLDELSERFASKLQYDQTKQQQIDILYSEVKQAREGLFLQILHPIFLSLIALHDTIGQGYEATVREPGGAESATARNYRSYQIEIEEILARSGVSYYRSDAGAMFDRERHRVQAVQQTEDLARDKTIALSQRLGFEYQGRVLRPESVVVYQYAAGSQS